MGSNLPGKIFLTYFLVEKLNVSIMVDQKQIEILKRVIILDNEKGVEVGVVSPD